MLLDIHLIIYMLSDEDKRQLVDNIEKVQHDIWGIILQIWVRYDIRDVLEGIWIYICK